MKKRNDAKKDTPKCGESLEDLIRDALIERGWLIPQTEEDVLRAERALARVGCSPLPRELADPYRIIDRLHEAFATAADTTDAGSEASTSPCRLPSSRFGQVSTEKERPKSLAYAYVSNESLDGEPVTDQLKLLINELRGLTRELRYEEALDLAKQATELEPLYWRAWISYGSLLALLGDLDEGEAIFLRVLEDFSDNPKAVAAALHNRAFAKEIRCELKPSQEELRELLPLYKDSLKLDDTRTNTRASIYIYTASSRQPDEGLGLVEDFLQREDFAADMSLETRERGARDVKTYKFLQPLPMAFRNRLYGAGSDCYGGRGTSAAY